MGVVLVVGAEFRSLCLANELTMLCSSTPDCDGAIIRSSIMILGGAGWSLV